MVSTEAAPTSHETAAPTFGVEEEFLLVDPVSCHPVPINDKVADVAKRSGIELQLELTSCQVETTSPVAASARELGDHLRKLRRVAAAAAETSGATLLAIAVPPVISEEFPITDTPRYQRIAANFGAIAREQGICGCHVHVAVPDREAAVQVSNHLRPWLPRLLALTANSAVYSGSDTGYASWRSIMWMRWPSAGPPPYFESASHYDDIVSMLLTSGSIVDDGMVYWDVRPSAHFPTVEIRVSDVPATVEETVMLATLVRAMVITALQELADGHVGPRVVPETLRAAYWKAAHDGLAGEGIDVLSARVVSTIELIDDLVRSVAPALEDLGEYDNVTTGIARTIAQGNGAQRQVRALNRRGNLDDLIAETARATLQ